MEESLRTKNKIVGVGQRELKAIKRCKTVASNSAISKIQRPRKFARKDNLNYEEKDCT